MSETQIEIVIGLLIVAIPLVAFARRAMIPYPIALVLGGLALGFVPGLPTVHLDPDLVLLIFLPPLLYWEAITAPTDVMLANLNQIGSLAIVLVVVTTVAVAVVAHAVIPEMPWAVAFVLGAVVAPTDELASAPVLERFRIPRHVIAIVEGESLVNDALSLVLYAVALTAATTGAFYLGRTALYLIVAPIGSILVGLIVGRVAVEGWRRIRDTELQSVISLLVPFVAYVPALRIGASGVLGVVTTGVFVNRFTPIVLTPESRLRLIGFWETFVFVANALLFLLVGLQLHDIAVRVFASDPWQTVLWATIATNVVVIVVRFVWIGTFRPGLAARDDRRMVGSARRRLARRGARDPAHRRERRAVPAPRFDHFPHLLRHRRDARRRRAHAPCRDDAPERRRRRPRDARGFAARALGRHQGRAGSHRGDGA
jgi:CPA1 family monovalent cation:H+ antiporter